MVYKGLSEEMENKILIPIDYTDISRELLQKADEWALWHDAKMMIMHVDKVPEYGGDSYMMESGFSGKRTRNEPKKSSSGNRIMNCNVCKTSLIPMLKSKTCRQTMKPLSDLVRPTSKSLICRKPTNRRWWWWLPIPTPPSAGCWWAATPITCCTMPTARCWSSRIKNKRTGQSANSFSALQPSSQGVIQRPCFTPKATSFSKIKISRWSRKQTSVLDIQSSNLLTGFWRNETLNDKGKSVYYHDIMNSFFVVKAGV